VLERGDQVIATARARHFDALKPLEAAGARTLELDVTWSVEELKKTAEKAVALYGRAPDVIVNMAGRIFMISDN
jgi:NAD(P)-dependent dehydrogenase (short-subunit alcohol dehydrogenase family)